MFVNTHMYNNSETGLTCNGRAQTLAFLAQRGSRKLVLDTLVGLVHNHELVRIAGYVVTLKFLPGDLPGLLERAAWPTRLDASNTLNLMSTLWRHQWSVPVAC